MVNYAEKVYCGPFLTHFLENYPCDVTINFHEPRPYSLWFHLPWVRPGNTPFNNAFLFHVIHFSPYSPALLIYFLMPLNHFVLPCSFCSSLLMPYWAVQFNPFFLIFFFILSWFSTHFSVLAIAKFLAIQKQNTLLCHLEAERLTIKLLSALKNCHLKQEISKLAFKFSPPLSSPFLPCHATFKLFLELCYWPKMYHY